MFSAEGKTGYSPPCGFIRLCIEFWMDNLIEKVQFNYLSYLEV